MLALGLAVLHASWSLNEADNPENSPTELSDVKLLISSAIRKIKAYSGPSKIWFQYQMSLDVGSGSIVEAVQNLPANKENIRYIWSIVMKLSKKLSEWGVDDSNGTVGRCVLELVSVCKKFMKEDPGLESTVRKFSEDETGFGFEEELFRDE